ncbi:hypothetical protein ACN47E_002715 [Coniothyrium glycines]
MASAWLASAQSAADSGGFHPHAAFAFIRTGERTPLARSDTPSLTALGANQMYTLGKNIRNRYIAGGPGALGEEPIANLSQNILDNNQVHVQTLDTGYLVSSAQAFMQGLYPPHGISNGTGDVTGLLADGTVLDFPLNGYQYPSIQASGQSDPYSLHVAGSQACPIAQRDAMRYFTTESFYNTKNATEDFYNNLPTDWFQGNIAESEIDFVNALQVSEYLEYQNAHNSTIYTLLSNDSQYNGTLEKARFLADEQAWYLYGNTSTASNDADNQAMAGKTLASLIVGQFYALIMDRTQGGNPTDMSYPLMFVLGEQEPIVSLISLMMADYHNTYFKAVPEFGSAMIFELFSTGANVDFPTDEEDLWVRFSFHNGTGYENNQLIAFPIFGNGPSNTDIQWREFRQLMSRISMDSISEWCETCASSSIFCQGVDGSDITLIVPESRKQPKVSPTVAGVIGAIVTLAVAGLLFMLAMLLGGIRFHRVQTRSKKNSELGGFKGSAKLASDPDLSLAKNVAPVAGIVSVGDGTQKRGHERVGSWELRQKEFNKDIGETRSPRASFDAIDAVAAKPVEPRMSV